jgi:hypothetical protein
VINVSADTIQINTSDSCLFDPVIYEIHRRFAMTGIVWGCAQIGTTHTFPPGETRSFTWPMKAEVYARTTDGAVGIAAAPKGVYLMTAKLHGLSVEGNSPEIKAFIRVR